jgi:hypothetical protein
MGALISAILAFFTPVVVFCVSVVGIVAFLLGVLEDPPQFLNALICGVIDMIVPFWPSTPEDFRIGTIITNLSTQIPVVGRAVIFEVFTAISSIAGLALVVKIYKLIPFKAT